MSRRLPRLLSVLAGASLAAALVASPARATTPATLIVGPSGGAPECGTPQYTDIASAVAAASAGDTILICPGTYALTATVAVDKDLDFVGQDAATTIIDGGGTVQLFDAHDSTVSFTGLTLRNGAVTGTEGGAAIWAKTVTITDSTLSGNVATIVNDGANPTVGGGAVWAETATAVASTFADNEATGNGSGMSFVQGGAIGASGTVTVAGSTFVGNAVGTGSATWTSQGGAVGAHTVKAANSTFAANSATGDGDSVQVGGGALAAIDLYLTNSTVVGNETSATGKDASSGGNAYWVVAVQALANTILAGDGDQCSGSNPFEEGSLATDASCKSTITTLDALALGPLADNGGPTQTMALGAGSVAIDAGVSTACASLPTNGIDQRGVPRPAGACDVGAYERVVPSITSFTPTQGPAGTIVTLSGGGFIGTTAVDFPGASASSWTTYFDDQLAVTVPEGALTGPITVTTTAGSATSAGSFTVDVPVPTITGFSPASGPVGTLLTITGTGFAWATSAAVNGTPLTGLTIVNGTTVTGTVAPGTTSGPVTVTTPGGTATSAGVFTFNPVPTITSLTPASGPIGTRITIRGTGLLGATSAAVNGTPLTGLTVVNATTITGTVALGTRTGLVSVTTPGGTATSPGFFTVTFAPSVTGFSPRSGSPGSSVTITGANFHYVRSVAIGGKAATFSVRTPTTIVATVPAGATTGPITVTSPYGSASSTALFYVLP